MNTEKRNIRPRPARFLFVGSALVGVMIFRALFCFLGICGVELEAAEAKPACHQMAEKAAGEKEKPEPDKTCCTNLFSLETKGGYALDLPAMTTADYPAFALDEATPRPSMIVAGYLDLPPPEANGPPLYIRIRSLLN